jgi:hypothetical protein
MRRRSRQNPTPTAPLNPQPVSSTLQQTASIPKTGSLQTASQRVRSFVRNILLADPLFPKLYADVVISSAPNSKEAKILARNYEKIIDRINMPNVKVCTHIKVNGVRCGSPALRGEQFCYFHQRMIRGVRVPSRCRIHPIAQIESEEAIQSSLMEVINALIHNMIDHKRAELILRALNIAAKNIRRVHFDFARDEMVREVPDYPAPPPTPRAVSPEPGVEVNAPPLTPMQTWANIVVHDAEERMDKERSAEERFAKENLDKERMAQQRKPAASVKQPPKDERTSPKNKAREVV